MEVASREWPMVRRLAGGCVLAFIVGVMGCDPAPRARIYNHVGRDLAISVSGERARVVKAGERWEGIFVLAERPIQVEAGGETWQYPKAALPREYWGASLATRIYLLQVEPDGRMVAVREQDLRGGRAAEVVPEQPVGFPLRGK